MGFKYKLTNKITATIIILIDTFTLKIIIKNQKFEIFKKITNKICLILIEI